MIEACSQFSTLYLTYFTSMYQVYIAILCDKSVFFSCKVRIYTRPVSNASLCFILHRWRKSGHVEITLEHDRQHDRPKSGVWPASLLVYVSLWAPS